jgi:hypothetical protein
MILIFSLLGSFLFKIQSALQDIYTMLQQCEANRSS